MRVVLIVMIIAHHLLLRGQVSLRLLSETQFNCIYTPFAFFNCFLIVAVNCFFLISGYFGIRENHIKTIKLLISIYFFYWLINLSALLVGAQKIDIELIKGFVFPVSQYWFVFVYLVLSLIAPFIEKGISLLSIKDEKRLIIILLAVWSVYCFLIDNEIFGANRGYSLIYAVILYIIGNYIKRSNVSYSSFITSIAYFTLCVFNGILVVLLIAHNHQTYAWQLFSYNNPIVLLASICLFMLFIKLDNNIINRISRVGKYTVYIYIVHSTPVFANWYIDYIASVAKGDINVLILISLIAVLLLFIIGWAFGFVYEYLFSMLQRLFFNRVNRT